MRLLAVALAALLCACGDDADTPEHQPVLTSPPPARTTKRHRDPERRISLGFPRGWLVERGEGLEVFRAQSRPSTSRHAVQLVTVLVLPFSGTLDDFTGAFPEPLAARFEGSEPIASGRSQAGDFEGRMIRFRYGGDRGPIVTEVNAFLQGDRLCLITGTCHEVDRPAFATTFAIILQSLQWKPPSK